MADSERIVRGTVTQSSDQNMREVQVNLQADEVRDGIEHFEPYGFSSEPFIDGNTDALTVFFDDSREHGAVICVADRRYRIKALEKGEVVIYDDKKRKIHFKRDGILIDGADSPVTVTTSANVVINASQVQINADVQVNGTLTATGSITGGNIVLQTHTHGGVESGGSSTGGPQ